MFTRSVCQAARLSRCHISSHKSHPICSYRRFTFFSRNVKPPEPETPSRNTIPVSSAQNTIDMETFRQQALIPEKPLLIHGHTIPAMDKWFEYGEDGSCTKFSRRILQHAHFPVHYELVHMDTEGALLSLGDLKDFIEDQDDNFTPRGIDIIDIVVEQILDTLSAKKTFQQFDAPLTLLVKAAEFNHTQDVEWRVKQLYVAQSQISDLPKPLQVDLPVPKIVKQAGKGDIYGSSIWLGLEPTYTPLHRDPNPNLFSQLLSRKAIRLLPPQRGQQLYVDVQRKLGSSGNSRFRGSEMMEGPERAALQKAVWGSDHPEECQEAILGPGDSLFIPKGWWHSVRSVSDEGNLNASVNWWFR